MAGRVALALDVLFVTLGLLAPPFGRILDVSTGTGAVALAVARQIGRAHV